MVKRQGELLLTKSKHNSEDRVKSPEHELKSLLKIMDLESLPGSRIRLF